MLGIIAAHVERWKVMSRPASTRCFPSVDRSDVCCRPVVPFDARRGHAGSRPASGYGQRWANLTTRPSMQTLVSVQNALPPRDMGWRPA
jgi:hypothetical protein